MKYVGSAKQAEVLGIHSITKAYLNGDIDVEPFCRFEPSWRGFENAVAARKNSPINRDVLVKALGNQYEGLENIGQQLEQIQKFQNENTFTITTGHQLCLLGGPGYFVYKILSVVSLANRANQAMPDKHFVPVFWMATEDHDIDEIRTTTLFGQSLTWGTNQTGATGRMQWEDFTEFETALNDTLGNHATAAEWKAKFKNAYKKGDTLANATRRWVHDLFGDLGVICIDGDDAALKQCFAPVVKQELQLQSSNTKMTQTAGAWPDEHKPQLHSRQINLFYLKENRRERIERIAKGYTLVDSGEVFSEKEILAELEQFPERFSPNAALRPVYQETILPNVAYIGGGAEVAYWLQLKSTFEAFKIFYPQVLIRDSAAVVAEKTHQHATELGFELQDFLGDLDALKAQWVKKQKADKIDLGSPISDIKFVFYEIEDKAKALEPKLGKSTISILTDTTRRLNNLEKKMVRAIKKQEVTAMNRMDKTRADLYPKGTLQERKESFVSTAMQSEGALDEMLLAFDPLAASIRFFTI